MTLPVLGIGSPLVDYNAAVTDGFIAAFLSGAKGGTLHLTPEAKDDLLAKLPGTPLRTPGGSAANTINLLARLGGTAAFAGITGKDEDGRYFLDRLRRNGVVDLVEERKDGVTGCCISLVTPDAERTMRSCLGVSMALDLPFVAALPLEDYPLVHLEGYMMQLPDFKAIVQEIKKAHCRISFDLSAFELAERYAKQLPSLLKNVDILFVNFAEQQAFTGAKEIDAALKKLTEYVPLAILKCGADGAYLQERDGEMYHIPALAEAEAVCDTTGAGDCFAAGFFFGQSAGAPLELCGRCGAWCAAEIVKIQGSSLPEKSIKDLQKNLQKEIRSWNTK